MTHVPIDLTTVTRVATGDTISSVAPGTFRVGTPVFTMRDENGETVETWGGNLHPLSYFFTDGNGNQATGPYSAITAIQHATVTPEPEPEPEPKHELLPVGTRVLVSEKHDAGCSCASLQPWVGKIAGYDLHRSKYQINEERYGSPGDYYDFVRWAFADNRVQVHPDGPEPSTTPEPVKQEPTGPRVYVKHPRGKDGYVVEFGRKIEDKLAALVQWHTPGTSPVWVSMDRLTVIHSDDVDRCPNGQANDECGSGENQCELCLEAEDAEAEDIERSMGLR